jgi:FAD/FMN-containing dehydrogenase
LAIQSVALAGLVERDALSDCLTKSNVPFAVSGNSNFTLESKPFNLRVPFTPDAIALPTTVDHVQAAVLCGASAGVRVSAKSGGHSYASHGLGGENGHLVIALKYMNSVTVDSNNIASIGAGSRLGNVAIALFNQSARAISHGTCPGYFLPNDLHFCRANRHVGSALEDSVFMEDTATLRTHTD